MKTPKYIADHVRRVLENGASAPHTAEVEWFFKNEIQSRGWYTAELRKVARRISRAVIRDMGFDFLVAVADRLFRGKVLEEKIIAVFLLEKSIADCGDKEFKLFESWIERVNTWADHDALAHYLLSPMILVKPDRAKACLRWARSSNRWHRRAASVSLVRAARNHQLVDQSKDVSEILLADQDLMVQKGLGWLLREWTKADPTAAIRYLIMIRERTSRLVLRTACETLPVQQRKKVLETRLSKTSAVAASKSRAVIN
jgi:3-methyladenine DNA glycosylase AlkD